MSMKSDRISAWKSYRDHWASNGWKDMVTKADSEIANLRKTDNSYWTQMIFVDGGFIWFNPIGQIECYGNQFVAHAKHGIKTFNTIYDAQRWLA